jgi:hypothetical protein
MSTTRIWQGAVEMGKDARGQRPDPARRPRKFGPSKASVQAAPGQTEAQILSIMRSLLGRPRATLQDAANLAGAPDDARVTVAVIPMHGRRIIEVVAENLLIRIKVLLHRRPDGKPVLVDELIDVVPVAQGQGLGTRFLGRQVEQAVRLGVAEIRAYASEGIKAVMSGIVSGRSSGSTELSRGRSSTSFLRNWSRPEGSAI